MAAFTASNTQFTGTFVEPFTYTFGYLSALALVTGILATVGFVLYFESQLPSYRRGYIMLKAMTMTRRAHLAILESRRFFEPPRAVSSLAMNIARRQPEATRSMAGTTRNGCFMQLRYEHSASAD